MHEPLVVVLAGGVGSRFWPASTPRRPKQLLPLASDRPLIVDTVERAAPIAGADRIRILTGEAVGRAIQAGTGLPDSAFMLEPQAKGTCPVLAWAAFEAAKTSPDTVLVSLHADHDIEPADAFVRLIQEASQIAHETERLLTIAVPPTRPEVGYGYIHAGEEITRVGSAVCYDVQAFVEKPNLETAEQYVADGYLWNSGIFVWRADTFLDEVRAHEPGVAAALPHLERGDVAGFFDACPNITVDDGVLEPSNRVATVPATFTWDDVGSWEALTRTRELDESGNVLIGDAHLVDSSGNVVVAEDGSVVLFGVSDLVVVKKGEVAFVTTRAKSPDLKALLSELPEHIKALDTADEDSRDS